MAYIPNSPNLSKVPYGWAMTGIGTVQNVCMSSADFTSLDTPSREEKPIRVKKTLTQKNKETWYGER